MKALLSILILFQFWSIVWFLFFAEEYFQNRISPQEIRELNTEYTFINPLLECSSNIKYYNTRKLQGEINSYIDTVLWLWDLQYVSYYARVLNNWGTFWYNEESEFTPASLIKLPLAIAVLKNTPLELLDKQVIIWDDMEVLQRNIWTEKTQIGQSYTIKELIENMLIYSDNIATEALFSLLWEEIINTVYNDLWLRKVDFNDMYSVNISPKQYASFFRILYNASYLHRDESEYLLSVLSRSDFTIWLQNNIPIFVRVANKFWERSYFEIPEKQLHDCGIIYSQSWPYVLCIMTQGENYELQLKVIQDISSMIYKRLL